MEINIDTTTIVTIQKIGEPQSKMFTNVNRLYTAEGLLIMDWTDNGKRKMNFYNILQPVWFNIAGA